MAPEINGEKEGSSRVDVFSLGCVVYQLAYDGAQPFYRASGNYKSIYDYF
jgi:serine/threonine protein kinase